jgi:hypothetical protein
MMGYRNPSQMLCDGCDHIIGNIPKPIRTSKSSPIEPLSVLRRGTTVERVVLHPFCTFGLPPASPPGASSPLALNSVPLLASNISPHHSTLTQLHSTTLTQLSPNSHSTLSVRSDPIIRWRVSIGYKQGSIFRIQVTQ